MSIFICNECCEFYDSDDIEVAVDPRNNLELLCEECSIKVDDALKEDNPHINLIMSEKNNTENHTKNDTHKYNNTDESVKPIISDHILIADENGNKILGTRG